MIILLIFRWNGAAHRIMSMIMSRSRNEETYERRFLRARSSIWFAWRALPNERNRSA
jgi:hypothetical protein